VTQTGERFNTAYYSGQGRKFRSVNEVSKFLNLADDKSNNSGSSKGKTPLSKKRQPRNSRELENERKKLRRELDKLMKNHEKASKALDDFQNEQSNDQSQVDDDLLPFDPHKNKSLWAVLSKPEIDSFPGLPASCTQEVLMAWDFLSTFNRTLSLHPIGLDDFAAALIYKPTNSAEMSTPPLYLAEVHLALLKLLLSDVSSDSWWWSTLETPELEAREETGRGEADNIAPAIKIDFGALLDIIADNILRGSSWMACIIVTDTKNEANSTWVLPMIAVSFISMEWMTMLSTQMLALHRDKSHWKELNYHCNSTGTTRSRTRSDAEGIHAPLSHAEERPESPTQSAFHKHRTTTAPWLIERIFRNNFCNIFGAVTIFGSTGVGMIHFLHLQRLSLLEAFPRSPPLLDVSRMVAYAGRLLALYAESWFCFDYFRMVVNNDVDERCN
jgi:hypothetical protein